MNFRKGVFPLLANLIGLYGFIISFVSSLFIFEYDLSDSSRVLLYTIVWGLSILGCIVGFIVLNLSLQAWFSKLSGGGKIKLHIGLIIDVYSENPIRRNKYIASTLFSGLIPMVIIAVFTVIFWSPGLFIGLVSIIFSFIAVFPVFIFALKQNKDRLFHFRDGILNVYEQAIEAASPIDNKSQID